MSRGLVDSSKYSPGNLTSKSLEQLFVGRDKLLADVLHRIERSATSAQKHRILLVGPRGIGKTHFVSLALQRLRSDPALEAARSRLVISQLNEEEWGIASYLDLLLRVIASCDVPEPERDAAERRVYEVHDARRLEEAIAEAEKSLSRLVGDRILLIVCENLGQILSDLGTSGQQRWRSFLQERTFCAILATSTRMVSAIRSQSAPFYGFFTIRALEPLDFETAVELLRRKALQNDKADLARLLGSPVGRARVRAIHHLAGGNPRVYVAISEFITTETLDDLVGPFMAMADDLTPYYQSRMQRLSPQQRKLIEQLSRIARPRPVKAIAERCLISSQTAAKQLGILANHGLARRERIGRETYYELAEPLMRICFEIKDNRTRHLQLFVDLLRHWFSEAELRVRLTDGENRTHLLSTLDHIHTAMALEQCEHDTERPFRRALTEEQSRCLDEQDWRGLELATRKLIEERTLATDFQLLLEALVERNKPGEASTWSEKALERWPEEPMLLFFCSRAFYANDELERALDTIDRAIAQEPSRGILRCARGHYLLRLRRWEDVIVNEDDLLEIEPDHAHSLEHKAYAFVELERWDEARRAAAAYTTQEPANETSWLLRAWIERSAGDASAAAQILARGIHHNPQSIALRCNRGHDLSASGRFDEVLRNERETLALHPGHIHSRWLIIHALGELGRKTEQLSAAQEWFQDEPASFPALRAYAERLTEDCTPAAALLASSSWPVEELESSLVQAYLLLAASETEESQNHVDRILAKEPANLCAVTLKIRCLLALSDYPGAMRVIHEQNQENTNSTGMDYLHARALVGARGLTPGVEKLISLLGRTDSEISIGPALGRLFAIETDVRGAVSLARQIPRIMRMFPEQMHDEFTAAALIWLHQWLRYKNQLRGQQWIEAIAILENELHGAEACRMPLELLSADANFATTKNATFLLALPIERRSLLEGIGVEAPPEFDPA